MRSLIRYAGWLLVLGVLAPEMARGSLLDWDTASWTAGSLNGTFSINSPNDVTISIADSSSALSGSGTPANNQALTGGLSPVQNSLQISPNFTSTSGSITVTVTFNYSVQNVSFSLFNIDAKTSGQQSTRYVDRVNAVQAALAGGGTAYATATGGTANSVTGSGTSALTIAGTSQAASTSGAGNATINFGTSTITQFQFTFGPGTGSPSNPAAQSFSLHDINFTPVPEVGVIWGVAIVCFLAIICPIFRQRERQSLIAGIEP
jgi:hypothetical protein